MQRPSQLSQPALAGAQDAGLPTQEIHRCRKALRMRDTPAGIAQGGFNVVRSLRHVLATHQAAGVPAQAKPPLRHAAHNCLPLSSVPPHSGTSAALS